MANEMQWRALAERVGEHGEELCEALKELYSVFGPEIVDWYASLYDPEHGMWYHSKSAQENEPYLPDAESLSDVMGFMQEMGATGGRGASPKRCSRACKVGRGIYEHTHGRKARGTVARCFL